MENWEQIEEELRKRTVEPTKFPPFFRFEREGQEIVGKVVRIRTLTGRGGEEQEVWEVQTRDGEFYTIPHYEVLARQLTGIKVGDYVLIRYVGTGKGKRGNPPKLFEVGVLPSAEAVAVSVPKPAKAAEKPSTSVQREKAVPKPEAKPEAPPALPKPEEEQWRKAENLLSTLAGFYERISRREVEERFKAMGIVLKLEEVLEKVGYYRLEGDTLVKAAEG